MLKDATYKEKFGLLKEWMPSLFDSVKKDLKGDHLKQDPAFYKKYFAGKNPSKLTVDELIHGYTRAIDEGMEPLGEFIANRWLLKNSEIYNYFEIELMKIDPNFTELKELDKKASEGLIAGSVQHFGAPNTYLFSVLNSVVFPKDLYQELAQKAKKQMHEKEEQEKRHAEKQSLEEMRKDHERELARITDKYEKKLAGLQKKYDNDIEALKMQNAALQRKMCAK
jgi:hypothetical protein